MVFFHWLNENWFEFFQSIFIALTFGITCITLERDLRSRRVENRFSITHSHREIWTLLYTRPDLDRVLKESVDIESTPVTDTEAVFVTLILLHLWSTFQAIDDKLLIAPEGLEKDIRWFFARPIPRFVWDNSKALQDRRFAAFVDGALNS